MLIQQREERTEHRCPREAGRINGSGVCGRRVREDVRVKEERLNPRRGERRRFKKANLELGTPDKRRLTCLLVAARGNQCNRADMIGSIRVIVNVFV